MCDESGGSPGRIHYLNLDAMTIQPFDSKHVQGPNGLVNYNPHGIDHSDQYVASADYVEAKTLVPDSTPSASDIVFRDTVRVFNLRGQLVHTLTVPNAGGFMDFKFIPGTSKGFTAGGLDNQMYFVDAVAGTISHAFDMTVVNGGAATISAGIQRITKDGKFLLMTYALRYVLSFRLSPDAGVFPELVQAFDFCSLSSINCTALTNFPG